ncbi:hypothetical protein [Nonomuraea sp. B1E8]|uniref:hypothetical protein n=1 Tax=unclassified Nonomuraea TaxID=2593643 RepID=UPI00325E6C05
MTVDDPYRREYRYSGGNWPLAGLAAPLLGGALLVVRLSLDDEVPTAVPVAAGVAFGVPLEYVPEAIGRPPRPQVQKAGQVSGGGRRNSRKS